MWFALCLSAISWGGNKNTTFSPPGVCLRKWSCIPLWTQKSAVLNPSFACLWFAPTGSSKSLRAVTVFRILITPLVLDGYKLMFFSNCWFHYERGLWVSNQIILLKYKWETNWGKVKCGFYQAVWGEVGRLSPSDFNTVMYECDVLNHYVLFTHESKITWILNTVLFVLNLPHAGYCK